MKAVRLWSVLRGVLSDGWVVAAIVTLGLYAASIVVDQVASSYPPVSPTGCTATAQAQSLSDVGGYLLAAGGFVALFGVVAARGRRWWFVGLLVGIPLLIYVGISATLAPGSTC